LYSLYSELPQEAKSKVNNLLAALKLYGKPLTADSNPKPKQVNRTNTIYN